MSHPLKSTTRSEQLYERACRLMPAGVNSPVRAFRAVGGIPRFIAEAHGPYITDADGHRYIDHVCSWGALILGHANDAVCDAIASAARRGSSYGAPHRGEVLLAEAIVAAMPVIEMLRFVNSGTEATMSAIRLARAATGRSKIIKFDGCYHGHSDGLLAKAGSGVATFGLPDSAGVPPELTANTLIAPYNDLGAVEQILQRIGGEVAAIIVEPVAGNMGVVPPADGFLQGLRRLTSEHGALLILDEVITGFRVGLAGASGLYGIQPDLVCIGKIIGGGLPVGAYGGRKELMELVAPLGPMYQAGTLSGNPVAMAAGLAVLGQLTPAAYANIDRMAATLEQGIITAAASAGVPAQTNRVGSMLSVFFTDEPVTDTTIAATTDRCLYARLFHGMLERGIYTTPSALETWFVSTAHTDDTIAATIQAFGSALEEAAAEGDA